jgi:undecaprenyl-diphosphatase
MPMNHDSMPGHPPRLPPHRRLGIAVAKAGHRVRRGGGDASEPLWSRPMTAWLVAGLVAMIVAGFADAAAIRLVHGSDHAAVRFMAWITNIGRSQWYLVPAGLLFFAIGLVDWSRRDARGKARLSLLFGQAAYVFASVALSGLLVNVLKIVFGRARPRLIDELGAHHFDPFTTGYLNASFPSGHATTVGAIAGILMVWYPRWSLLFIELGLFIAATRIAAEAHYPSDVVAGFLLGSFFSIGLARWLARRGVLFRIVPGKILPPAGGGAARKSLTRR